MNLRVCLVCLVIVTGCMGYYEVKFSEHTRTIRRADFYEAISGPNLYLILYYYEQDEMSLHFIQQWNDLAEDYSSRDDIVFLQVNCEFDMRLCRQQAAQGFPYLKAYQNGELYKAYNDQFFIEIVREFIEEAAKDVLQETVA